MCLELRFIQSKYVSHRTWPVKRARHWSPIGHDQWRRPGIDLPQDMTNEGCQALIFHRTWPVKGARHWSPTGHDQWRRPGIDLPQDMTSEGGQALISHRTWPVNGARHWSPTGHDQWRGPGIDLVCTAALSYESHREKTCLMPYRNNKGADQTAHPCSCCSLNRWYNIYRYTKFQDSSFLLKLSRPIWVLPGRKTLKSGFLERWLSAQVPEICRITGL